MDLNSEKREPGRRRRIWLAPLLLLFGSAFALFLLTFLVDSGGDLSALSLIYNPDPQVAHDAISNAGEIVAGVLGIAITVVAIVVELASNRYTHRVTELFVQEPINFAVTGFFVVTAIQAIAVGLSFSDGSTVPAHEPTLGMMVALGMLLLCLLLLLPYFAFVFDFLNPVNILDRIRRHTMKAILRGTSTSARQREAVRGVEQIADVGLNAMEHKDKGISMASVDVLKAMVVDYANLRGDLDGPWFRVEGELAHNPDFVSMSEQVLDAVSDRKIWFEMKILRKYQTLYNEALNRMRDINYLIAINTRHLAEHALRLRHEELLQLVVKFFNTYLRATINARDVRTAYNVLHQYRRLAERALEEGRPETCVEIAQYFKYYGLVGFNAKLPFVLETAAYDLCELNEIAFQKQAPIRSELLQIFLEVDKESEGEVQELSLRGVRKAQVKLASYYLAYGDEPAAREIFRDMERERRDRLASIRDELLGVRTSEFWEISDRGVNFDFIPEEQKEHLLEFFSWFVDLAPPQLETVRESLVEVGRYTLPPGHLPPAG